MSIHLNTNTFYFLFLRKALELSTNSEEKMLIKLDPGRAWKYQVTNIRSLSNVLTKEW